MIARGVVLAVAIAIGCSRATPAQAIDLEGRATDPLAGGGAATVLVFVTTTCPVSNRYAPEVQRLATRFGARGVTFHLVYPSADDTPARIVEHTRTHGYSLPALRDPGHVLVDRASARATPEAAVFVPGGRLVYHGRIDDRQVDLATARQEATRHELEQALEDVLAGRAVSAAAAPAVGCSIPPAR